VARFTELGQPDRVAAARARLRRARDLLQKALDQARALHDDEGDAVRRPDDRA